MVSIAKRIENHMAFGAVAKLQYAHIHVSAASVLIDKRSIQKDL